MEAVKAYVKRRDIALSKLDMDFAREMLPFSSCDEVRVIAMHKARYECTNIAAHLRLESGAWLGARGYKRMTGEAILPDDRLPE